MDCELFDRLVIDRVFAELDDLASGAIQRHVAHCSRCRSIESTLRAAREVTALATPELPPGFVEQVMNLERSTRTRLPLPQRFGRAVSVMSGYAMRPQLTMCALLLLMIGSSLFLLRARPGDRELVHVTERGVPEGEVELPAHVAASVEPPPAASASISLTKETAGTKDETASASGSPPSPSAPSQLQEARDAFAAGNYTEAHEIAERAIKAGGGDTAQAALLSATALAKDTGCASALARFEALRSRHGRSAVGDEAAWRAAECHESLGQADRAKQLYTELRGSGIWGPQARERLRGNSPPAPKATVVDESTSPSR